MINDCPINDLPRLSRTAWEWGYGTIAMEDTVARLSIDPERVIIQGYPEQADITVSLDIGTCEHELGGAFQVYRAIRATPLHSACWETSRALAYRVFSADSLFGIVAVTETISPEPLVQSVTARCLIRDTTILDALYPCLLTIASDIAEAFDIHGRNILPKDFPAEPALTVDK